MNLTEEKFNIYGKNVCIIVAMAENHVIGKNNDLPWHIKSDLTRFKKLTKNNTVIMGRKTYESIGQPLKYRDNIVISGTLKSNLVKVVPDLQEAIRVAMTPTVFICGGKQVYEEALEFAQIMYITLIHKSFVGDTLFPDFDETEWSISDQVTVRDDKSDLDLTFLTLHRNE